ncbi:MAG: FecR domain-containing protein [Pyrinomonadaceae bacterium]
MKRKMLSAITLAVLFVVGASASMAQNTRVSTADKYLISASAGHVNYTEGSVAVIRADTRGTMLIKGDKLGAGERVSTDAKGRAEVLLNPGSYLRLGENSEFEFITTDLDDLRLKLHRGSAIFEVFATNEFRVSIFTPKGRVTVVNSGVYRIDLNKDGSGLLSVTEGQAVVGEKSIAVVKDGFTATLSGGKAKLARFDRDQRDDFAEWSRARSKDLGKMASKLKNSNMRTTLIDTFYSGMWGSQNHFGVWAFNPYTGSWCFLPYYSGWRSPYGWGYGSYFSWYHLPPSVAPTILPTRLDGRLDPPSDFEGGNNGSKSSRSRPDNSDKGAKSRDLPPVRDSRPSIFDSRPSREPVYSPPPAPTRSRPDKPIDN